MKTKESRQLFSMAEYVQEHFPDRDCMKESRLKDCALWMIERLKEAGYEEEDIHWQEFEEEGKTLFNLEVTKIGKGNKVIIAGAHMDGDGISDNASGMVLLLYEASALCKVETEHTLKFVFFTGEEYGLYGSDYYGSSLSQEEVDAIEYMINLDSLGAGDDCFLYGGVYDEEKDEVVMTELFDQVFALSESLGLGMKKNPWTKDHMPEGREDLPYSPMTLSEVSDNTIFSEMGIPYVYFEATSWTAGKMDGYTDTEKCGPVMNTEHDNLAFLEEHFPGRYEDHLARYQILLDTMLRRA